MDPTGAAIQISLLGSWQITGGLEKELRRKEQGLLAYLALEADQPHSRDSLLGLFWPDMTVADAHNNLRVALSRLKHHLGDNNILETTRHTISLNLDSRIQLDVIEFQTLVKRTETHRHAALTGCQACQELLDQAVNLYRGEFLAGFFLDDCLAFEEWRFVWRERLHVQMLKQLDRLTQAAEDTNRFADAERYARRQIELDPLHESAHRQLMRALYAQGQRSTALSQFQTCEALLQDELGVEPETETLMLRDKIQTGSYVIAPSEVGSSLAMSPPSRLYALPEIATPFIGREVELDQISRRLAERSYRLFSLVGPGGIGKTRLAIQAARAQRSTFRDGVFFVPLESVLSAAEIPAAIAAALDIPFSGSSESPQTEIIRILHDKHLLLIVDSLEHVIDGGAELLLAILEAAPDIVLLVTSREQLNAQEEDVFRLRGLPYPDMATDPDAARYPAVRLFADRAHRINKDFGLSDNTLSDVIHVCHLVEGLPLGLELAATWVRDFSVEQIATSLAVDFALLETDLRDISPRHRSIATVFEHSWALLTPDEQETLPQLAVFRGGFNLAAAKRVTGVSPLVLTRLRYKSLLRGSGDGRYTMHELLRQLALRKLIQNPAVVEQTRTRHSRYFLSLLQKQTEQLNGIDAAQAGAVLRLELDNIRQAWRWAVTSSAFAEIQQSAAALAAFFAYAGLGLEGVQLLQLAIDSPGIHDSARPELLPLLLVKQLSILDSSTLNEIIPTIDRIFSLTQQDPALSLLEAETYLVWSAKTLDRMADPKQARSYLNQAFELVSATGDSEFLARLYCESGRNYLHNGQFDNALAVLQKALTVFQSLGHLRGQALVYSRLAPAYAEAFHLGPALNCDREALRLYMQVNDAAKLCVAHHNLAETYALLGAYEQANDHAVSSLEMSQQQGLKVYEINTRSLRALIMDRLGHTQEAERQYQVAIADQKALKLNFILRYSLLDWGDFQLRAGRLAEAEITFDEAIRLNGHLPHMSLTTRIKQAMVYWAQDKPEKALVLVQEAWPQLESNNGAGLPFPLNTMYECYLIFQARGDDRAEVALEMALDVLKRTAAEIDDPEMRTSFLNRVPVNRQLRAASHEDLGDDDVTLNVVDSPRVP
jgi:predicted ATPase/DNA-binding SARP family transcriptional activator